MEQIFKYPRTQHIEGSRLQPGDHDLSAVPFREIAGRTLVVEEKLDGANAAISFGARGELRLQSRGHYLVGGRREKHFELLKSWATVHKQALFGVLGARYVMYGEWLYAKHTVFYDVLPHYFMEFDVLDTERREFLSTPRRRELLCGLPVCSVPVLSEGTLASHASLTDLLERSQYKTRRWQQTLAEQAEKHGVEVDRAVRETDGSELAEGLYIKHEDNGRVEGRFKYVRASFLTSVLDSGSHWLNRPIIPNVLAAGMDIFAGVDP